MLTLRTTVHSENKHQGLNEDFEVGGERYDCEQGDVRAKKRKFWCRLD